MSKYWTEFRIIISISYPTIVILPHFTDHKSNNCTSQCDLDQKKLIL